MNARDAVALIAAVSCAVLWACERPSHSPVRSVAVITQGEGAFAEGVGSQLIAALSRIHALRVIAPGSVLPYAATRKPPTAITADLNVDALIAAAVVRSGDRIIAALQLTQGGKTLWSKNYDRDIAAVDDMAADAAKSLATAAGITVTAEEQAALSRTRRTSPDVLSRYWQAKSRLQQGAAEESIPDFQQALEEDPNYAPARAALSLAYSGLSSVTSPPAKIMPLAKAAAAKAVDLDDQLAEAHIALATVLLWYEYDWTGAERELKRALDLNPSSADAYGLYGNYLNALRDSILFL